MSTGTITTQDRTTIFYKDWGTGQPVVFSHGWPLNADAWDDQLFYVASQGYRAIAHDRRGGGRSSQPWGGNDMDHYADDLAALLDTLDLPLKVLVWQSADGQVWVSTNSVTYLRDRYAIPQALAGNLAVVDAVIQQAFQG